MGNPKLYIVMVGLPARGKSTLATKIKDNLLNDAVRTRIFNNGDLRRKLIPNNTSFAEFYNPKNSQGMAIREEIARINIKKAHEYLKKGGNVAILDATNASLTRRKLIQHLLNNHPILFIECINNNDEILKSSIMRKIETKEFSHLTREEARISFGDRISYYVFIFSACQ